MENFEKIYEEYGNTVYAFLMSLSHDKHLSEELTQETMFKAIMNYGTFRGECKLSVWLCQIAKNLYYQWYNKNKNKVSLEEMEIQSNEGNDILMDLENKEAAWKILKHLHILEEPYKEVFTLHVLGDVSLKDISRLFNKSDSWARVTYYRAKNLIANKLEEENS